jgi:hypothetical protein
VGPGLSLVAIIFEIVGLEFIITLVRFVGINTF